MTHAKPPGLKLCMQTLVCSMAGWTPLRGASALEKTCTDQVTMHEAVMQDLTSTMWCLSHLIVADAPAAAGSTCKRTRVVGMFLNLKLRRCRVCSCMHIFAETFWKSLSDSLTCYDLCDSRTKEPSLQTTQLVKHWSQENRYRDCSCSYVCSLSTSFRKQARDINCRTTKVQVLAFQG